MNELDQFFNYIQKVYKMKELLRAVRDERSSPLIPTLSILITQVMGVVVRISSYLDLAQQTKRRRWRHLCGLKSKIGKDIFWCVTQRLRLEDLRGVLSSIVKTLKSNKALESCKINGLMFLSLDANEHFSSRSRCCPCCCQRQVEVTDDQGNNHSVTEYYHRYVFAQINGPKLNVLLDLEPILPGEDECSAALRLLG